MQDEKQPQISSPNTDGVEDVMGPTIEESQPVSVPNESPLPTPQSGAVVTPVASSETQAGETADEADVRKSTDQTTDHRSWRDKLKHALRHWWKNPKARYGTIGGILAFFIITFGVPPVRYFVLNNVGVRASTSVKIYDSSTKQPLKNVQVTVRGVTVTTDKEGLAKIQHLKLGKTKMVIARRAFAGETRSLTLGWGSNPLGNIKLKPVGSQYLFEILDYLSGRPINEAEASSGELSAISDEKGKLLLTIDPNSEEKDLKVTLKAEGYRSETVSLDEKNQNGRKVSMVIDKKHAFVSKRDGKYDLYKIDIDGKNEELVLKGTGNENPEISLVVHPTENIAALVSTRENVRNKDGFILSSLSVVDLQNNKSKVVTQAEKIQPIGWVGNKLVFAQVVAGASASNPNRQKLVAYDSSKGELKTLAGANAFNDVAFIGTELHYAISSALSPGGQAAFYKISLDGTNRQTVLDKEVWNVFRTSYDSALLSVQNEWYLYKKGSKNKPTKLTNAPADLKNRFYLDSPDAKNSLWIDERDGKGVLVVTDTVSGNDKILKQQAGLNRIFGWQTNDVVVYRISSPQETADYALSLSGGEAKKIRDVTNANSFERWYYY